MAAKPVVAGTDGSEESLRAVDWAAREALIRGLPLRIMSAAAMPPRMTGHQAASGPGPETVSGMLRKNRDHTLAAAAERAAAVAPGLRVDVDALAGAPAYALTEAGSNASMLVVGARGVGRFTAMILGSVSQYVSAHATCPVVVVREETTTAHRQVGVGIGDPDRSAAALAFAFEEAALRKASLIAVHAWDSPYGEIGTATWALATPASRPWPKRQPGGWTACWPTGRASTRMSRSATTSSTLTRDGHWSACQPAPTSWCSAGT